MIKRMPALRRIVGIGLAWCVLWFALFMSFGAVIGVVDPDSIDPGDTHGIVKVIGSMGFLSGIAFGVLASVASRGTTPVALSLPRAALWGILGTAIVQLGYLDHGDAGLMANIQMALLFCGVGGVIAVTWLLIARRWSHVDE